MMNKGFKVAYLGPAASFSQQAALSVFSPEHNSFQALPSFASVFQALQSSVQNGESQDAVYDYAIVPFENSTNGSVVQVLDLLAQCGLDQGGPYPDLEVCAEYYLSVHHCLFVNNSPSDASSPALPNGNEVANAYGKITTLYSHPQVWGQCNRFLQKNFHGVERIDLGSTSAAAQLVAKDSSGTAAAISSSLAGEVNGLRLLATNIEDEPDKNTTRFFMLRNRRQKSTNDFDLQSETSNTKLDHKSLIAFTVPHFTSPGSLADALAVFRQHNFNLTSIDTRPSRKQNWHYIFLVECEESRISGDQENLKSLLSMLHKHTESLLYLGSWKDQLKWNWNDECSTCCKYRWKLHDVVDVIWGWLDTWSAFAKRMLQQCYSSSKEGICSIVHIGMSGWFQLETW